MLQNYTISNIFTKFDGLKKEKMNTIYIEDKNHKGIDYSVEGLATGDYDNCTFDACNFANSDLSEINFTDCEFRNCDLSLVKTNHTAFKTVNFKQCKLLGLHFEDCNDFLFSVDFVGCQLNLSSFLQTFFKKNKV